MNIASIKTNAHNLISKTSIPPKHGKGHAKVNVSVYIAQREEVMFFGWSMSNQQRNPLIGSMCFLFICMWMLVMHLVPIKRKLQLINCLLMDIWWEDLMERL
jgi:hypothetical protein